jgi:hypothetical protein
MTIFFKTRSAARTFSAKTARTAPIAKSEKGWAVIFQ